MAETVRPPSFAFKGGRSVGALCSERQTSEARTCIWPAVPPIIVSPGGPHPSIHPCRGRSFLLLSGLSGNLWSVFLVTRYDRPAGLRFAGWHPRLHFPECSFFGGVVPSVLPPFCPGSPCRCLAFFVADSKNMTVPQVSASSGGTLVCTFRRARSFRPPSFSFGLSVPVPCLLCGRL